MKRSAAQPSAVCNRPLGAHVHAKRGHAQRRRPARSAVSDACETVSACGAVSAMNNV